MTRGNEGPDAPPVGDPMSAEVGRVTRTVYGISNLRTDGTKLVMPQKLERPTPSGVNWDVHRFEFEDGELKLVDDERPPLTIVSVVTRR